MAVLIETTVLMLFVFVVVVLALVIARQRYMLKSQGGIPLAARRGNRWLYGVARYEGDELRWYRAFGFGTRPTRVLRRDDLQVQGRREPTRTEMSWLPASAVIADCRDGTGDITIALADGAFEGFISWLEASSPHL
jgi:Protein of unknown function (DUF2550)